MRRPIRKLCARLMLGFLFAWILLSLDFVSNSRYNTDNDAEMVLDKAIEREVNPTLDKGSQESHSLPYSLAKALSINARNGFLLGNKSSLTYQPLPDEVDLRIIVMVYNRPKSLKKCLNSLIDVDYLGDRVSLHVWIDRHPNTDVIPMNTYLTAKRFIFKHGQYYVHVQPNHVGIQGQWLNTWRPRSESKEIALFLEDDMSVSPFFYR